MTRTFACLAAALALLSFTGCGDPPNSGVAVAANTGPLKPLPPLPEDQNAKITPPPLAPSALPAIEAPTGDQQQIGRPPANGASNSAPPGDPGRITLSNLSVRRLDQARVHFEVNYTFTAGQPNPQIEYVLGVSEKEANVAPRDWLVSAIIFRGSMLSKSGTMTGEVRLAGTSPDFTAGVLPAWWGVDERGERKQFLGAYVSNDIDTPSNVVSGGTPPAAPPSNGGGGLLQSLFGDNSAAKTPTPNGSGNLPNAAPASGAAQIALSGAEFLRINKSKIHFEVNYVFTQGEPKPTNWYTVVLRERGNVGGESQHGDTKFEGKDLRHSGKLEGDVNIGGRSPSFDLHVTEGSSREENGHQISDVVEAAVRRDLGRPSEHPAPAAGPAANDPSTGAVAPPAAAPANNGGGLLESLFGNKPTEKAPPPKNAPTAPSNGTNNTPSNPPADGKTEIALSGVTVGRNQGGQVHFLAAYAFIRGRPVASNWYTVVVQEKTGRGPATPAGEMKIDGGKLQQRGDLEGNVTMGGNGQDFEVRIMEGTSRDDKGRLISNVGIGEIHHVVNGQDIGHPERAAPGVGAQGKDYGPGLVTTPISAYFAAKQLIVFTIQLPNAMKFFKAQYNRDPNSQDEFMEKIIKDNGITLPELPTGERYVYNPQSGELMVEHPKK